MKKVLAAILMAVMGVTSVMADDIFDDENPGGWDFELPMIKVGKNNSRSTVEVNLSSSLSFGFIGGINQAEGVSIDMGQSFEISARKTSCASAWVSIGGTIA